jgi:hypothetical protein
MFLLRLKVDVRVHWPTDTLALGIGFLKAAIRQGMMTQSDTQAMLDGVASLFGSHG